jgi:magnesium transporter
MTTTILSHGRVTWTNIVDPTPDDIRLLAERYPQLHPLNLKDCLTELEYPKLDHYDDYIFLIVQFPYWDQDERISRPAEVDIFVTKGVLVTSHRNELKPLVEMFNRVQADEVYRAETMGQGASPLLYRLLNALVDYCFPIVHKVSHNLQQVETGLFHGEPRNILNQVALLRRDIITLRGIMKPQLPIADALIRGKWVFIHDDLDPYWGDIHNNLEQLCSLLDQYVDVVAGLSDTVDTLASHRIDEVVRVLTIVTVLTLPITVLSTIFSMNVSLPFGKHPLLFFTVTGIGVVLTGILLWYLHKHHWI